MHFWSVCLRADLVSLFPCSFVQSVSVHFCHLVSDRFVSVRFWSGCFRAILVSLFPCTSRQSVFVLFCQVVSGQFAWFKQNFI